MITPICQDGGHSDCRGYVVYRETANWMAMRMEQAQDKKQIQRKMGKNICECPCHYTSDGERKKAKR